MFIIFAFIALNSGALALAASAQTSEENWTRCADIADLMSQYGVKPYEAVK